MKNTGFLILTILVALIFNGCNLTNSKSGKSAEKFATETRGEFGFREIKAGNAVNLIISVQKEYSIVVEGEESLLKDVKTEVEGETLIVTTKNDKFSATNKIRLKISLPELRRLELWGASEAAVTNVNTDSLKLQIGGSSNLRIEGETKSLNASADGASKIDAENLKTENAEVRATGTCEITVAPANELIAEAVGASTIFYLGEPKNIKPSIAGSGEIRRK